MGIKQWRFQCTLIGSFCKSRRMLNLKGWMLYKRLGLWNFKRYNRTVVKIEGSFLLEHRLKFSEKLQLKWHHHWAAYWPRETWITFSFSLLKRSSLQIVLQRLSSENSKKEAVLYHMSGLKTSLVALFCLESDTKSSCICALLCFLRRMHSFLSLSSFFVSGRLLGKRC